MHVARKSENSIDFLQDVRKHPSTAGTSVPAWLRARANARGWLGIILSPKPKHRRN